ncbi:MAG: thioredoxin family protein [Chitinophagales bacterium]|nr:thioredoxin family protein [Chitinophagales bacterium]
MNCITQEIIDQAFSYNSFRQQMRELVKEGKTTGLNQSEGYVHYTKLNHQRMKRLDKTIQLEELLLKAVKDIVDDQVWLVLVEAWCGDVAQNLPYISKMAEENERIDLKLLLRDENPEIMDNCLTNGSRSIPKLLILKKSDLTLLEMWGPRPAPSQEMVMNYKANPGTVPYSEFSVKVQEWYNDDKGATLQKEFKDILQG